MRARIDPIRARSTKFGPLRPLLGSLRPNLILVRLELELAATKHEVVLGKLGSVRRIWRWVRPISTWLAHVAFTDSASKCPGLTTFHRPHLAMAERHALSLALLARTVAAQADSIVNAAMFCCPARRHLSRARLHFLHLGRFRPHLGFAQLGMVSMSCVRFSTKIRAFWTPRLGLRPKCPPFGPHLEVYEQTPHKQAPPAMRCRQGRSRTNLLEPNPHLIDAGQLWSIPTQIWPKDTCIRSNPSRLWSNIFWSNRAKYGSDRTQTRSNCFSPRIHAVLNG